MPSSAARVVNRSARGAPVPSPRVKTRPATVVPQGSGSHDECKDFLKQAVQQHRPPPADSFAWRANPAPPPTFRRVPVTPARTGGHYIKVMTQGQRIIIP